jgi:hypothetical protein
MIKKEIAEVMGVNVTERFFDDNKKLAKEIKLTKEEIEIFEKFEWIVLCDNGLRQINGGYSSVTIYKTDEDEEGNKILICEVVCGEQDTGGGGNRTNWYVEYNRKTQKFEER